MTAIVTVIVFSPSSFNHALRRRQEDRRQFDVISTKRIWSLALGRPLFASRRSRASQPEDREAIGAASGSEAAMSRSSLMNRSCRSGRTGSTPVRLQTHLKLQFVFGGMNATQAQNRKQGVKS
jgi:hypothetical protein